MATNQKSQTEAVLAAYQWAFKVVADRHAPMMHRLCARSIQYIRDSTPDDEVAYQKMVAQIVDWRREKRDGFKGPIKALSRILGAKQPAA
jgi:hypothetical protein